MATTKQSTTPAIVRDYRDLMVRADQAAARGNGTLAAKLRKQAERTYNAMTAAAQKMTGGAL